MKRFNVVAQVIDCVVAPAPRGGRGLKRRHSGAFRRPWGSSACPSGRARIETFITGGLIQVESVAPAPRGGRGLKQQPLPLLGENYPVAPAPRGGRGLKRVGQGGNHCPVQCSACPSGRARIETSKRLRCRRTARGSACPSGRARIETGDAGYNGGVAGGSACPSGRARIETS